MVTESEHPEIEWSALPEPVRARLVELAAAAVGEMAPLDVPQRLKPVARFVPAKRARVAASSLLDALRDKAFRAAVVEWTHTNRPDALETDAADPVHATAASVLLDTEDAEKRLRNVAARTAETELRAERDAANARADRLQAELQDAKAEVAALKRQLDDARADKPAELERLKERLRTRGVELKAAREAVRNAEEGLAGARKAESADIATLRGQLEKERRRADAEHARAESANAQADLARRTASESRTAEETRLALLLDTLEGAVDGLRTELRAPSTSRRPADSVAGTTSTRITPSTVPDVDVLDRLLVLPRAHLVADGYNVTKTGYPHMPLADQRERLVRQLGVLAARTGAEITAVFDGAGVVAAKTTHIRGVRVLFSEPGVTADDVIKALVAAEPRGRPLVVATSDREIVTTVRADGARAVSSAVLLDRLDRG